MTNKKDKEQAISKDKEEEMSSALIAQLLAEDAMIQGNEGYYAEYNNDSRAYDPYHVHEEYDDSYEENSEDDFNPRKKYGSKISTGKRGRKKKASVPQKEAVVEKETETEKGEAEKVEEESAKTEKKEKKETVSKKPRKPVPEGHNTGVYTELEEKNFLEGLELFGRDWTKLQQHIATRDANSIRSHAQKHFIKMYRDNIPLPPKVRESGDGYTLSGKPLDPTSSAARPYLSRTDIPSMAKKQKTTNDDPMDVEEATKAVEKQTQNLQIIELKNEKKPSRTPSPSQSTTTTSLANGSEAHYDAKGRTSYSSSRLRRQRESVNYGQISSNDDPLTMIKCEPFTGKPGSGSAGCQPFEVTVESNVLLAMDFHAHLMTTEIIGFLAGEWDKESMRMTVREAFPCRSIETGQNDVNVEMDPTSAIETRQLIEERHMKVVGWYHSHPTFIPDPSLIDIENQRNYQTLCRDEHPMSVEPFVGAIVGSYDPALPGSASAINWFHVANLNSDRPVPKRIVYELKENDCLGKEEEERMFALLDVYKESPEKVVFAEHWRQDVSETKLQKMIKSLGSRIPWIQKALQEEGSVVEDIFLKRVQTSLKDW
ncbi:hypothetical protein EDC96DRAFT_242901 [Choanephora cucurbitarum]|nr:hypothetical protein EDC96DRAFT_242901 [Choanephora cucurbitarum]